MRPIALLLFLTVLTPAIRAGEVDAPERLLETLVRQAVEGPEIDEPSPTSLVGKLLRSDQARLRGLLKRHWDRRHRYSWDAARALEDVTSFLYGMTPETDREVSTRPGFGGLWEFRGVVMLRKDYDGRRWDGPFQGEDLPLFEERFVDRKLRAPIAVSADSLWPAFLAGAPDTWGGAERASFAVALGETARGNPEVAKKVLSTVRARPRSRLLPVVLGAMGGGEAATILVGRFRATAPNQYDRPPRFLEAVRCLSRIDPDGVQRAMDGVEETRRPWVHSLVGTRHLLPGRLRALEAAAGDEARRSAFAAIDDLLRRESWGHGPERELPRHLRLLVRELDTAQGAERATLLGVAKSLLGVAESYPISGSFTPGGESFSERGEWQGPIGGVEGLLRTLVEDLDAGRLVLLERRFDWWRPDFYLRSPIRPVKADGSRAHTDVPGPEIMTDPDPRFPVHASSEYADGKVRLTLRNVGTGAFLLSPEALRYGSLSVSRVTTRGRGKPKDSRLSMGLDLGRFRGPFGVPVDGLVEVKPGGTFSWTFPVPGEIRSVQISLHRFPIVGETDVPVLLNMNDTWIR